jgi:hypothetical protein
MLDACVLYPTVMREVLLAVAGRGLFRPLWSARILEEWARAARKLGPLGEAQARSEVALVQAAWPGAHTGPLPEGLMRRLYLPDADDIHVLAAAIAGNADILLTLNAKDFPKHTLSEEGVARDDPDGFLYRLWLRDPAPVEAACAQVTARAAEMDDAPRTARALLKKARLPRLAKAVG